jgi:hypothetical protein
VTDVVLLGQKGPRHWNVMAVLVLEGPLLLFILLQ